MLVKRWVGLMLFFWPIFAKLISLQRIFFISVRWASSLCLCTSTSFDGVENLCAPSRVLLCRSLGCLSYRHFCPNPGYRPSSCALHTTSKIPCNRLNEPNSLVPFIFSSTLSLFLVPRNVFVEDFLCPPSNSVGLPCIFVNTSSRLADKLGRLDIMWPTKFH